jgi:hypothetical protein
MIDQFGNDIGHDLRLGTGLRGDPHRPVITGAA